MYQLNGNGAIPRAPLVSARSPFRRIERTLVEGATVKSKRRRSARRHFRHGHRAAVIRAITAAKLYIDEAIPNLTTAAECCGSNVVYVTAAVILLRSENAALQERVLKGHVPLLAAAAQVKQVANLVTAYRAAKDADRIAFARACGTDQILDVLATASH
jgi:hypothetical protein